MLIVWKCRRSELAMRMMRMMMVTGASWLTLMAATDWIFSMETGGHNFTTTPAAAAAAAVRLAGDLNCQRKGGSKIGNKAAIKKKSEGREGSTGGAVKVKSE